MKTAYSKQELDESVERYERDTSFSILAEIILPIMVAILVGIAWISLAPDSEGVEVNAPDAVQTNILERMK